MDMSAWVILGNKWTRRALAGSWDRAASSPSWVECMKLSSGKRTAMLRVVGRTLMHPVLFTAAKLPVVPVSAIAVDLDVRDADVGGEGADGLP